MSTTLPSLFLSYARGDDDPFVKQLHGRFVVADHDVWWDRECTPSRARSRA
jgi:hypothetical protein